MPQATINTLQTEHLPEKTGVYIFKGDNAALYIGKAKNIRKRVEGHIQASKIDDRERRIIEATDKIDYIVTETETEALIEENILIKAYKPKHNVRLSDDKTYPYIRIDTTEDYPCISITRKVAKDDAKYFGPYGDVGAMRNSLKTIRRIFPIRTCRKQIQTSVIRPCTYYHIGQCSAPCAAKITKKEYNSVVNGAVLLLEGKLNNIIQNLRSEMSAASMKLEYERAATLRDRISDLEKTVQTVRVVLPHGENLDAVTLYRGDEDVCIHVLQVREGKILSSENFNLNVAEEANDEEVLESFLKQYYLKRTYVPGKLILNKRIGDAKVIAEWLSKKCGSKIVIQKPSDTKLKAILDLAYQNARTYLEHLSTARRKAADSLLELRNRLGLKKAPRVIECFDISNLGQRNAVGSKISFLDAMPNKREYRRYKIRTIFQQDDQAMIAEIVDRRFTRLLREGGELPDLVIVDGGITQVLAAKRKLDRLAITTPIIGLAKKLEQIYLPNGTILEMDMKSKPSLLLQQIRDEAHRFAISYHRKRRERI